MSMLAQNYRDQIFSGTAMGMINWSRVELPYMDA
jgi:hypothetical protein